MTDISGRTSPEPLAFYDRVTQSWKTSQGTFLSDLSKSSLTLPKSGTTVDGRLYELRMLEPRTVESDSFVLPTPRNSDANGSGIHGSGGMDLRTTVVLLPTPVVNDMGDGKSIED